MNRKTCLLLTALLSLAVVCGILLSACDRSPTAQKEKYYRSAIELLKKGKESNAALQLRNALKIDPQFVAAENVLAEIEAQQGDYKDAYFLLLDAKRIQPDYLPVRKGLAFLYRLGGKFPEALAELNYVLARSPNDTDALFSLGTIQVAQNNFKEAETSFNRVLEIQPGHETGLLALASLKDKTHDIPAAERFLKLALERNPRSANVYLNLIKFYIVYRRSEVEPLFAQALQISPNNASILQAQAGYYEGLGRLSQAEEVVREIQSLHPEDPKYRGQLADFYIRTNNWTKALVELEIELGKHRNDRAILHKLIELRLSLNDRKTAEALNNELLDKNPDDSYGHLFKGRMFLADGQIDKALSEFNEAHQYEPDLPALHYWYAKAYIEHRQLGLARQSLETALRYDPSYRDARLELVQIQKQAGAIDAALANAQILIHDNPGNVQMTLVYTDILLSKGQYPEAARLVKEAAGRAPGNAEAHRQLGILQLIENNVPMARNEFEKAWDLRPQSRLLLEGVLMSYLADKQAAAATDLLQREIQKHSNAALLYHELGQLYAVLGKRSEAIAALQKAMSLDHTNTDTALLLADLYVETNQNDGALPLIRSLAQNHRQDPDILLRAGTIFEKLQRWDEAQHAYERVVELDGDNAEAKNNLAWVLVSHGGNVDVALSLAEQAEEKLAGSAQVADTIGWIYYKKSLYKTAVQYLSRCAQADQKNATFQYHLGMTYLKLGSIEEGRRALLRTLTLDPHFAEAPMVKEALASR
jgi:tetratricopeptide (TPR) repeat protein